MICTLCGEDHSRWLSCQSYKDRKKSEEILKNHKTGRICKEWQCCSKCSFIKYLIKILRHAAGAHKTRSRSCPVCTDQYCGKDTAKIVKRVYMEMTRERGAYRFRI